MARILVVDDEEDMLTVSAMLLSLSGHEVLTAHDGARALDILASTEVDLVVTDWMMPRMDGTVLCRRVKESERTRRLPVILTSAAYEPPGVGSIFDAFLRKPWDIDQALVTIGRILERRR